MNRLSITLDLSKTEWEQLKSYVEADNSWYYGNRKQFEKRYWHIHYQIKKIDKTIENRNI